MEGNKIMYIVVGLIAVGLVGYIVMMGMNNQNQNDMNEAVPQQKVMDTVDRNAMMEEENEAMMEEPNTIVDVAVNAGNFDTLVTAVTEADLVETLSGPGPFTVFAPTDDAFAKLPDGTIESLLADKEQLTGVLTYHVVAGKVMAADVVNLTGAQTVNGQELTIEVLEDGTVMVNDSKVIATDIEASNGVIHVIDTVLLPE